VVVFLLIAAACGYCDEQEDLQSSPLSAYGMINQAKPLLF
jgi:hypothetical protein